MRVAVDVDGVCAALHVEWYRRYNRDWNDDLTQEKVGNWHIHEHVKPECGTQIYNYLSDVDLYENVPVIEGALEGVEALRTDGHEICFATSCVFGMTDQKARWLIDHGFTKSAGRGLPKEFVAVNNKTLVNAKVLIDDRPSTVEVWHEQCGIGILFGPNTYSDEHVDGLIRAANWDEVLPIVREIARFTEGR